MLEERHPMCEISLRNKEFFVLHSVESALETIFSVVTYTLTAPVGTSSDSNKIPLSSLLNLHQRVAEEAAL